MIIPAQRAGLAVLATAVVAAGSWAPAQGAEKVLDSIHFLIPGGAGGGRDGTARGTGEALTKSGIIASPSYENMSGGGRKAIGCLIENAESNHGTLMVNSTPIITRSLSRPVAVDGAQVFSGELYSSWSRYTVPVVPGPNPISTLVVNGTGFKRSSCSHENVNTGEMRVTGTDSATRSWRHRGGAGSSAQISVLVQ